MRSHLPTNLHTGTTNTPAHPHPLTQLLNPPTTYLPPTPHTHTGIVDDGECFKTLLGGVMMSDRVVTVSPSYREEICTPMGGWGLVTRKKRKFSFFSET